MHIPASQRQAEAAIRSAGGKPPGSLGHAALLRAWFAIAYTYPGLHPDGYQKAGSGWPKALKMLAAKCDETDLIR